MSFHSGFVSVVGKANVGKSTLVNALVGKKVSIVSPKVQTTRNKIIGILNEQDYQVIFIDTPGIHKIKNQLDKFMQTEIDSATQDVDLMLYVLDGSKDFDENDLSQLQKYCKEKYPVYAVVNKIDLGNYEELYPRLDKLNSIENLKEIFAISALKEKNLEQLKTAILSEMKDDIQYYPTDIISDKSQQFVFAELIREKMLWQLREEIPHGAGVVIEKVIQGKTLVKIYACIYCEKETHKSIILGKNGLAIKKLGIDCRQGLEKLLGKQVYLELFVRVKPNWREKEKDLTKIGYCEQE